MATIQTAIGITDRMTPVFHTIINALDTTINTFETARSSINKPIDADGFEIARSQIDAARIELEKANIAAQNVNESFSNIKSPSIKTPQLSPPREPFLTPIVQKARLLNVFGFLEIVPKIPHILFRYYIIFSY